MTITCRIVSKQCHDGQWGGGGGEAGWGCRRAPISTRVKQAGIDLNRQAPISVRIEQAGTYLNTRPAGGHLSQQAGTYLNTRPADIVVPVFATLGSY